MTAPRRRKGEGSVSRNHADRYGCPASVDGERPDHKCAAPYRARVWVHTSGGDRVRKTVYGTTEREVLGKVKVLNVAEAKGEVVRASGVTVADWLAQWFDAAKAPRDGKPGLKINTQVGYEKVIRLYLVPHVGRLALDRLQPKHVDAMYQKLRQQGLAEPTIRQAHAVLRRALVVAVRQGLVGRNVADLVEPPKARSAKPKESTGPMLLDDALRALRAAGPNPRYWLALLAGLRQGEALALRWADLYLEVPEGEWPHLVVRQAVTVLRSSAAAALGLEPGIHYDSPKSRESTDRMVPLVAPLPEYLRAARDKAYAAGAQPTDLVFTNTKGNPMDSRRDHNGWLALLDLAGVGQHYSLHQARNTTAGLLELAGVPDRVVAAILGHSQVSMTHHYQRGNVAALGQAAEALTGFLRDTLALGASEARQDDTGAA